MTRTLLIFGLLFHSLSTYSQETIETVPVDNYLGLTNSANLNAANPNFFNERGLQKERGGSFEEALELYMRALNMAPLNPTFLYNVGITYQKLNKHNEAVEHLKKSY